MSEDNYEKGVECDESAVWIRKTKDGEQFLSIKIKVEGKEFNTVAFKNKKRKEGDRTPHFAFFNRRKEETVSGEDLV